MRRSEKILQKRFYVEGVHDGRVWLIFDGGEYEMAMSEARFARMFGRQHMQYGHIGTVAVKIGADGKSRMRGWPYKRKWTAEEIAEIERQVDDLMATLKTE